MPEREDKTVESRFMFFRDVLRSSMMRTDTETPRSIHCFALKYGFLQDLHASSKLPTLYGKTGDFVSSLGLFGELEVKDVAVWNSMITTLNQNGRFMAAVGLLVEMIQKGTEFDSTTLLLAASVISAYELHGMGEKAMKLFKEMSSSNSGMEPNKSTFISLLSACSHSGFIDEGLTYYYQMEDKFRVKPATEHRVCIVDMLGRAGKLREVYEFITGTGESQQAGVWGALLSACKYHGDTKLGTEVAEMLFEMEPGNASYYISLSNTHVVLGSWEEAARQRKTVDDNALKKLTGYSAVEVSDV